MKRPAMARRAILFILLGATACGSANAGHISNESDNTDASAIVGGVANNGFTSVGMLTNTAPGSTLQHWCTATLIARATILTAAHCVMGVDAQGNMQTQPANVSQVAFHLGSMSNGKSTSGQDFQASAIRLRPGFNATQFVSNVNNGIVNDDDVALVDLAGVPNVQGTLPSIDTAALTSQAIGVNLTLVGYGSDDTASDTASAGVKRYTTAPLLSYDGYTFRAGTTSGTCAGDSGGPAFYQGVIVGITQAGPVSAGGVCGGNDYFTRLDTWQSFLLGN